MKKVLAVLAGAAAIGGVAWVLYKKFGKPSMLVQGEFDDNEPIVMDEDEETAEDK